jgi:uncharacterized protein YjbJ (UPF0337 family)
MADRKKGLDPNPDANRDPITGEPGAHPVGVGAGGAGGAAAGAAIGGAVGGPVGALVGGAVGAVAGGYAGKAAGEAVNPTEEDTYWKGEYVNRPYARKDRDYSFYQPAYRYGWESATHPNYMHRPFNEVEPHLEKNWTSARGTSAAEWRDVRDATRDSYERVHGRLAGTRDYAADKGDSVWDQMQGNWHQAKGFVKEKWNDLTDDEVDQMEGRRERIVGKIQERYGEAKWKDADIERELKGWRR